MIKAIVNGKLVFPDEIKEGTVLIEDGKILAAGDVIPPKGAEIIDAEGLYVGPGLVDEHNHGFLNPETGEAMEKMPLLPRQVFDNVEAYFKNICEDKVRRTKFLQQVIKDWFYKRINTYGQLSVNTY